MNKVNKVDLDWGIIDLDWGDKIKDYWSDELPDYWRHITNDTTKKKNQNRSN